MSFRTKKIAGILSLIALACLSYWLLHSSSQAPQQPIKIVEIEIVALTTIAETEELIGTVRSKHSTTLMAKKKGILNPLVSSGQIVKKGDLIAKIENPDIEQHYTLSQKFEEISKLQYERANQLLESGSSSKSAAEDQMKNWIEAQKRLAEAKIALDEINLTAPFDGIVGLFKTREGSQVLEGDTVVALYDPSSMTVELNLPLNIATQVNQDTTVRIQNHSYPLTHLQKMLDEASHMSPADVDIECEKCVIGSTLPVQLVITQKQSVLSIPYDAVFLRNGAHYIYQMKNHGVEMTSVILGIREKDRIEIVSGLAVGDAVIIRGQDRLYPGMPVKTQSEIQTPASGSAS